MPATAPHTSGLFCNFNVNDLLKSLCTLQTSLTRFEEGDGLNIQDSTAFTNEALAQVEQAKKREQASITAARLAAQQQHQGAISPGAQCEATHAGNNTGQGMDWAKYDADLHSGVGWEDEPGFRFFCDEAGSHPKGTGSGNGDNHTRHDGRQGDSGWGDGYGRPVQRGGRGQSGWDQHVFEKIDPDEHTTAHPCITTLQHSMM